jgi:phage terminase small subunit
MTDKQKVFCEEYLIDLNATQAAIRAGYSVKTAYSIGEENLKKPEVQREIERLKAQRSRRTGITADRVLQELARIGFVNPMDVIDADDATVRGSAGADDMAAIASVKVKVIPGKNGDDGFEREVRLHDKVKALELMGKHLGMFTDKVDLNANLPVIIAGADTLED